MKYLISIVPALFVLVTNGQDSLDLSGELGVRGRRQTGNFNQFSINPYGKLVADNERIYTQVRGDYQLLYIEGFRAINDLWTDALVQWNARKRFYPFGVLYYGFADSYSIDHSLTGGLGIGTNLLTKQTQLKLQAHLFAGFLDVAFEPGLENQVIQQSAALGSIIRGQWNPEKSPIRLNWEFQSYHATGDSDFFGLSNRLELLVPIGKHMAFSASHLTIYNNTVSEGIAPNNTLLMFGVAYSPRP
jgi:hypothetical protein